ncbi:MAG: Gfo/Idh/MocA family oxidoreductase [Opitutales bacterium]|nr:Gfo/Idh/MocA family oxidoreductase [Opitutales bacterium]
MVIGCGGIFAAHSAAFEKFPERLQVAALSDASDRAMESAVERLKPSSAIPCYRDHRQALREKAGECDFALVLTPHYLHFEQARDCLNAGLPVLIEKPACAHLQEARALLEMSRARALPVMVGQTRRFEPQYQGLRAWMRSDPSHFGPLRTFEICGFQNIEAWIATKPDRNADFWILDKERAGGGVVTSLMVHLIDLVRYLFDDDFAEVSAVGRLDSPFKNGAESACTALLHMQSGATGTLHGNYLARKTPYSESFKFFGEHGCIGNHTETLGKYFGSNFVGSTHGKAADSWEFQYEGIGKLPESFLPKLDANPFVNQLLEFASAITEQREPESSLQENLNTIAVIEAIYQSLQKGGDRVKVERTPA